MSQSVDDITIIYVTAHKCTGGVNKVYLLSDSLAIDI